MLFRSLLQPDPQNGRQCRARARGGDTEQQAVPLQDGRHLKIAGLGHIGHIDQCPRFLRRPEHRLLHQGAICGGEDQKGSGRILRHKGPLLPVDAARLRQLPIFIFRSYWSG